MTTLRGGITLPGGTTAPAATMDPSPITQPLSTVARVPIRQRDILSQMDFKPLIAGELKVTDTSIYKDGPYGLRDVLYRK